VEPFFTSRKPDYPYSCIGPWHGDITLGQSIEFFVPYITQSVTVDPGEIMYDFCWVDMSEWLCAESERHYMIRDVCDVCLIGRTDLCLKNEIHSIIGVPKAANDLGFYFKKSYKVPRKKDKHKILDGEVVEHKEDRGDPVEQKKKRKEGQGRVAVFKQIKDRGKLFLAKNKLFSFLSFPGIINSFPQNGFSSMIYDIYCQSLISYFNVYLQNGDLHSYYSMSFGSTLTPTKVTVSKDISSECHLKNFEGYIRSFDYIRLCFRGSFNDVVSYDSAVFFFEIS